MSGYVSKLYNLLSSNNVCCVCLIAENAETKWNMLHEIVKDGNREVTTLRDMLCDCFDADILKYLPTEYFCEDCANMVIKSYLMLHNIKRNYLFLLKCSDEMMKHFHHNENAESITICLEPFVPKEDVSLKDNMENNNDGVEYLDKDCIFECPLCFKSFDDVSLSKKHYDYCSKREKGIYFKSDGDNKSLLKVYSTYESYTCGICPQSFGSLSDLKAHRIHHKQVHQRPKRSSKVFNEPPKVKRKETNSKVGDQYSKLELHNKRNNNQQQCPSCLKTINTSKFKKHHCGQKREKVVNKTSCTFCSYKPKDSRLIDGHLNKHHLNVRPYLCVTCSKSFHCKIQLAGHVKTHQLEKTEQCHICGQRFAYKKSLIYHIRAHTGEKPYMCMFCDMRFLSSSRRREHELSKHTDTDFTCSECNRKYTSTNSLRAHRSKSHHKPCNNN